MGVEMPESSAHPQPTPNPGDPQMPPDAIARFLHAQVDAWNGGDRQAFFDAYRAAAPRGLQIEYVGKAPAADGWPVLEAMWAQQSAKIAIEEALQVVNGSEAACHNRNKVRGTAVAIETIEVYRFDDAGRLSVRYFVQPPAPVAEGPPQAVSRGAVERFMRGQVECWNAHDKAGLMALYREMAPEHLAIGYAGRSDAADGWLVIEEMFDKHNAQFRLEVVQTIVNGDEVAVHHRNCIVGSDAVIESIETYRFEPGRLSVAYFLKPPAGDGVDLQQFRGLRAPA